MGTPQQQMANRMEAELVKAGLVFGFALAILFGGLAQSIMKGMSPYAYTRHLIDDVKENALKYVIFLVSLYMGIQLVVDGVEFTDMGGFNGDTNAATLINGFNMFVGVFILICLAIVACRQSILCMNVTGGLSSMMPTRFPRIPGFSSFGRRRRKKRRSS